MQIEISQSRQFKYSIVYVVKDAISYNCFTTIMQHFVVKNAFISRHQMAQLVFRVPPIVSRSWAPSCEGRRSQLLMHLKLLQIANL